MPVLDRCVAALRVFGDDLDPDELSRLFNCSYTEGWVKGFQYSTSSGAVVVKKTGGWILDAGSIESGDFDAQVSQLLSRIDISVDDWAALKQRFEIDVFCGWFMRESSEGVTISPGTMRLLSERHIPLSVDIYAPSDDE